MIIVAEDEVDVPVIEIEPKHSGPRKRRGEKEKQEDGKNEEKDEGLSGEDYLFLLGLGLFITYLIIAHPKTPSMRHGMLILSTSVTMLVLSMASDYLNREVAEEWMTEYRGTRLEGFYTKIYNIAKNSGKYFDSDTFFVTGVILTILAIVVLFMTGEIQGVIFGTSYGAFMRAILV